MRSNFYQILRDYQTVRVWELRLERAQRNLEHALEREDPLDIANARIDVPATEASMLRARRAIDTSLDQLKKLIGMDVRDELDVERGFDFTVTPVTVDEDIAFCFRNHEEILNLGLEIKKLEDTALVKREARLPEVKLSGTATQDSEERMDLQAEPTYKVGLSLAWELGRKTDQAQYRKADYDVLARKLGLESLKQEMVRQLRDLARKLDETAKLIGLQDQRITVGERQVELYRDRWENGEIDILEYVRSQNDLENSRIELINLKTTYMERLAEYLFTTGK